VLKHFLPALDKRKLILGVIIFGSVRFLLKKSNQIETFFKKIKTETGSN
jgi:hypothetical protein